jgi:hypothetical protein
MVFLHRGQQGPIFWSENYIYPPPPFWKLYFSLCRDTSFFNFHSGLFALILILQLFYPFTFPFLIFFPLYSLFLPLSSFFLPLSSFFLPLSSFFFYIFPLFLFTFSYFFPQMTSADISPGGGYFPIYRPPPPHRIFLASNGSLLCLMYSEKQKMISYGNVFTTITTSRLSSGPGPGIHTPHRAHPTRNSPSPRAQNSCQVET